MLPTVRTARLSTFSLFGRMMKKSGCKPLETEPDNLKRLLEEGVGKSED